MRLTVLASGSKGNSAVISSDRTSILVDCGLSCREIFRRMHLAGEDPSRLSAILITHEHQDHVSGLGVLARRLGIPVFFTEPTHRAWVRMLTPRTTMSYAQWLDRLAAERGEKQREREREEAGRADRDRLARLSALPTYDPLTLADPSRAHLGPDPAALEAIAHLSAEAAGLDPALNAAPASAPSEIDTAGSPCETPSPNPRKPPPTATTTPAENASATPRIDPTFLPEVQYFHAGKGFAIGDIDVNPFTIPHDATDPCGFVFSNMDIRFGLATDLGYMPPNVKAALRGVDLLLLESNHDLDMLRDGPYPWSVKQRVLSRVGHLSNLACAEFLEHDYDGGAHTIVLAHLSESNNDPELAKIAAEQAVGERMRLLGNRILLAQQDVPLAPIEL